MTLAKVVTEPTQDINDGLQGVPFHMTFQSPVTAASPHIIEPNNDNYQVPGVPLGTRKPIKIIHIGFGFGGINMAYQVKTWTRDIELVCYEKNAAPGGTWHENKYPGCACDIPSHDYQFTWAPNPEWSKYYSSSDEIERYVNKTIDDFGLASYVKLSHSIQACSWDEDAGEWVVTVQGPDGKTFEDRCNILVNGSGILNKWKWPTIKGLHSFKGKLIHSARFDWELEKFKDKKVLVIGAGSTAVQIVPQIQPLAKDLKMFVRSRIWITPGFAAKYAGPGGANFEYTEEQKAQFRNNPEEYRQYRKNLEYEVSSRFKFAMKNSPEQKMLFNISKEIMESHLVNKPHIAEKLIPTFTVGCRRPTPGNGFLEAIAAENADCVFDPIAEITAEGIVTNDGTLYDADVIICATGFNAEMVPIFPITGRNKTDLGTQWRDIPEGYLSLSVANFPNYFISLGPSSPAAHGSVLPILEVLSRYILKFANKLQIEPTLKAFEVKHELIRDFQVHRMAALQNLTWSSHCNTWFKKGGPNGPNYIVHPGSRTHFIELIENPRFEDYDYTYNGNRFAFFGNGYTLREEEERDLTWLFDKEEVEKPFLYDY